MIADAWNVLSIQFHLLTHFAAIFETAIGGEVSAILRPQFGLAVLAFLITQLWMLLAILAFFNDLLFWHF